MEPLDSLNRWSERLRDPVRAGSFARFVLRRFLDDRLFEASGALAYTTVFALVPLVTSELPPKEAPGCPPAFISCGIPVDCTVIVSATFALESVTASTSPAAMLSMVPVVPSASVMTVALSTVNVSVSVPAVKPPMPPVAPPEGGVPCCPFALSPEGC